MHHLTIDQVDELIHNAWSSLSAQEQELFRQELAQADEEYKEDVQTLIDTKLQLN